MIPTMILFGLVLGWRWRPALVSAAVVWPAVIVVSGVVELSWTAAIVLLGAAILGAANAAVGILVTQGTLALVRGIARRVRPAH